LTIQLLQRVHHALPQIVHLKFFEQLKRSIWHEGSTKADTRKKIAVSLFPQTATADYACGDLTPIRAMGSSFQKHLYQ
jgi:hypothetical protein